MPVFFHYAVQVNSEGFAPQENQEAGSQTVPQEMLSRTSIGPCDVGLTWPTTFQAMGQGIACYGMAGYTPLEGERDAIFWEHNNGVVSIRVHNRLVIIDTNHRPTPDSVVN